MKKILSVLAAAFLMATSFAQNNVPNNGFEQWTNGSFNSYVYAHPEGWTTALVGNFMTEIFGMQVPIPMTVAFGEQTSDAHSGNSALKLKANTVGIPGYDQYSFTCPGIAQLGSAEGFSIPMSLILNLMNGVDSTFDFSDMSSLASLTQLIAPGDACMTTPASVKMWVKYLPTEGDSMTVMAYTKMAGSYVSMGSFTTGATMAEYTQIEVPFDDPLSVCDTIGIIIMSGGMNTNQNTELYVDDITLSYNVGIQNHETVKMRVYPNPATDILYVEPAVEGWYRCQLTDLLGRVVASVGRTAGRTELNVSGLAPGVYMLRVESDGNMITKKVIVR